MNEKCEWTHARLSAAHDGALTGREQAVVNEHLADCDACRQVLEEIRHSDEVLGPCGPLPGPVLATDELLGRLHVHLDKERRAVSAPWWRSLTALGLGFAAVGGLAAVMLALRTSSAPAPDQPQVAVASVSPAAPAPIPPVAPAPVEPAPASAPPAGVAPLATPAVEVASSKPAASRRMHEEIGQIRQQIADIDQRFSEFKAEARRLAGEQDRSFADRRLPEWK